jgi:hypothetical protein
VCLSHFIRIRPSFENMTIEKNKKYFRMLKDVLCCPNSCFSSVHLLVRFYSQDERLIVPYSLLVFLSFVAICYYFCFEFTIEGTTPILSDFFPLFHETFLQRCQLLGSDSHVARQAYICTFKE